MPYTIREIGPSDRRIFSDVVRTVWTAHHHPYQPHFSAYHPVFGPTAGDRERAIEASAEAKWASFCANESQHWIYVVDTDRPEIVTGVCLWHFHSKNPYPKKGEKVRSPNDGSMWPEGSVGREFVETMMQKQYAHRVRWLRRKHAIVQNMSVLPSYRKQGIGLLLMQWGMSRAADRELEVFLHATDFGRGIYERCGLRPFQKIEIDLTRPNPSNEWERIRHDFGPLRFFLMWKPVDGIYEEGVTDLPWEKSD